MPLHEVPSKIRCHDLLSRSRGTHMTGRKSKPKGLRARKPAAEPRRARKASKGQDTPARAAAPLLAHTSKKVSAPQKSSRSSRPQAGASYQPKTQPPATPVKAEPGPPAAAIDILAMAQPWMTIGWRMTAAGLSFQASMARAALSMPPAATAMRQGAEALNAWFALMQTRPPKGRKG
jgi:hypothetical protein